MLRKKATLLKFWTKKQNIIITFTFAVWSFVLCTITVVCCQHCQHILILSVRAIELKLKYVYAIIIVTILPSLLQIYSEIVNTL